MKKLGNIVMIGAALAGGLTPQTVSIKTSGGTVVQIENTHQQRQSPQGGMQARTNASSSQSMVFDGLEPLYRGWNHQPFAPWRAPLYNQRKARRRARQRGTRVIR